MSEIIFKQFYLLRYLAVYLFNLKKNIAFYYKQGTNLFFFVLSCNNANNVSTTALNLINLISVFSHE
jgi:hypothetical protein